MFSSFNKILGISLTALLFLSFGVSLSLAETSGPVKPYSFSAVPGKQPGTVDIHWYDDETAQQYNLLYGTANNKTAYGVINMADIKNSANSFTVGALNPGQVYYFTLLGIQYGTTYQSGPVSARAASAVTQTQNTMTTSSVAAVASEYNFRAQAGDSAGTVKLFWTDNATANHYHVVYGTTPGVYLYGVQDAPFTPLNTSAYTIGALQSGRTYYFALVAVRDHSVVAWTAPVVAVAR
jgi:hypothetical protein